MSYTLPTRPAQKGGTVPFLGPYAQNQAAAELAWQQAQTNLAAQRGQMLQQYGFMPTANGMAVDPNNPYGQYQQTLLQNEQGSQATDQAMTNRGFAGPGLATQAAEAAQLAAGARSYGLAQSMTAAEQQNAAQLAAAQAAFQNATVQNQYNATQYAISKGIFTPAAAQLSDPEVKKLVQQMQAAWSARWGGPNAKNAKGHTFQQRLDQMGTRIYNPTATFKVGRKVFH